MSEVPATEPDATEPASCRWLHSYSSRKHCEATSLPGNTRSSVSGPIIIQGKERLPACEVSKEEMKLKVG